MRNRRLGELGLESEMMMVFCSEDYPAITSSNEHNDHTEMLSLFPRNKNIIKVILQYTCKLCTAIKIYITGYYRLFWVEMFQI